MRVKFFKANILISFFLIISLFILPVNAESINAANNNIKEYTKYYISTDGDNSNDGSYFKPLKDLYGFKQKLISDITNNKVSNNVSVIIKEGTYYFNNSFSLSKVNLKNKDIDITFKGTKNVVFTNGISINDSNYTLKSINNKNYIVYDLSKYNLGFNYNYDSIYDAPQVLINNKVLNIARYPNEGYTTTNELEESDIAHEYIIPGSCNIDLDSNDINMYVSGYFNNNNKFSTYKSNYDNGKLYVKDAIASTSSLNVEYYLLNSLKLLDTESEYYIDYSNKLLYLLDTEANRTSNITISLLNDSLITLNALKNVSFENISFNSARKSAIKLNTCNKILINNCSFNNINDNCIYAENTINSTIRFCKFTNCSSSALNIKNNNITNSKNKFELNTIDSCCTLKQDKSPMMIIDNGITIKNNKFNNNSYYTMLLYGSNNKCENNVYTNIITEMGKACIVLSGYIYNNTNNTAKNNILK